MAARTTTIQSIIFDRKKWTVPKARAWLKKYGKKIPAVDSTARYHRFRQADPNQFVKSSFRIVPLGKVVKGIKAIIGKRKVANPKKIIRLPRRVVNLGRCVEIHFDDGTIWKPKSRKVDLCCSESGKTLWVLPVSTEKKVRYPRPCKLYERFHGYLVSGVKTANVEDEGRLSRSGQVEAVVYESDKWDNKKREYIHTFRHKPRAYADNIDNPSFVKISGGKFRVKPEGIVG